MRNIGIITFNSAFKTKKIEDCDFIEIVNLEVEVDGKSFTNKTIEQMSLEVNKVKKIPKTSQPTSAAFLEAYEKMLKEFKDVIVLTPDKELSGTHQNAVLSVDMLESSSERIHVVETRSFAFSETFLAETAIDMILEDKNIDTVIAKLEEISHKITTYIIPGNFEYLKMSGRVNVTQLLVSKIMSLKLLIKNKDGHNEVYKKARGFKGVLKEVQKEIQNNPNKEMIYYGSLSPINEEIKAFSLIIKTEAKTISTTDGSIVMAAHFGPGTIGFMIVEK